MELIRSGVIEGDFDYENPMIWLRLLWGKMSDYNFNDPLKGIKSVMTQLGVMPSEESKPCYKTFALVTGRLTRGMLTE